MNNYKPKLTSNTNAQENKGTQIYKRDDQDKILAFESTVNTGWNWDITEYKIEIVRDPGAIGQRHIELDIPEHRANGGTVFQWLDYLHEYKKHFGKKLTYKELARLSGYAEATFKQEAVNWKLETGN